MLSIEKMEAGRERLKQQGEQVRGKRPVDPTHWHYKVYQWWLCDKRPRMTPQLNFCHYWRVVLLWSLPRLIASKAKRIAGTGIPALVGLLLITLAMIVGIVLLCISEPMVLVFTGCGIAVGASIFLANYWYQRLTDGYFGDFELRRWRAELRWAFYLAFGVPAALFMGIGWIIGRIMDGYDWLLDHKVHHKANGVIKAPFVWLDRPTLPKVAWLYNWALLGLAAGSLMGFGSAKGLPSTGWGVAWALLALTVVYATIAIGRTLKYRSTIKMLQVPGFIDWLVEYRLLSSAQAALPIQELAKRLNWSKLRDRLESYVSDYWNEPEIIAQVPMTLRPKPVRQAMPPKKPNPIVHFFKGTWALVMLIWEFGARTEKGLGMCPLLEVKAPEPPPRPTDQPADEPIPAT